nr:MAG TPA: endonuclease-like protein [Caudoviricetes sp.]
MKGTNRNFKSTCQEKYGVDYPVLLKEVKEAQGNIISKLNTRFCEELSKYNINYSLEYRINDLSYDIAIQNFNILIEINPTYTHTVLGNHYNGFKYNEKFEQYHINKTNVALNNGYHCINVWDWDNWDKIISLLTPKQKLYARKLQLKEITKQEANAFLNIHHLQESCYGNEINLGLFNKDNNQLVQVMTFGKPRYNKNYQWELLRLCSHSDYIIIGGTEKLFKYFVTKYNPESIISYCDISKFTGNIYTKLGFTLKEQTKPAKIWSKNEKHITDNLLRQYGFDKLVGLKMNPPQLYGKGINNEELITKHGWLPIYDCGQKVFIWTTKIN